MKTNTLGFITLLFIIQWIGMVLSISKRSIDLIAAHGLMTDPRLPRDVVPLSYVIDMHPYIEEGHFNAQVKIIVKWKEQSDKISLHVHEDLIISNSDVKVTVVTPSGTISEELENLKILRIERIQKLPIITIHLEKSQKVDMKAQIEISYYGKLYNDTNEGLFRGSYIDSSSGEKKWYLASNLRPNSARKVFPCFDEPLFKATFLISIVRSRTMTALSNMPMHDTEDLVKEPQYVKDNFYQTPVMSTFEVAMLISEFVSVSYNKTDSEREKVVDVNIWARPDFIDAVQNSTTKVFRSLTSLGNFWNLPYPLPKLDCIALPTYLATRPVDSWGLIMFKESELSGKGIWHITHELVYQWIGGLVTPVWWSSAHINNALAKYIATFVTKDISDGKETFHNWPMTMLYSIYYELSKRYPHGKAMAIKQDSISTKIELVFRMLHYILGEKSFINGLGTFVANHKYGTFVINDVWKAINEEAHLHGNLEDDILINEVANSWVTKDRLPVVTVIRNYEYNNATASQRVYLRERPHDVPDKDKYLWWIPLVLVRQDAMDFKNSVPLQWMKNEREVSLVDLPKPDQFIILNPEEIGPFPVNYDITNWNLLANYLQTKERTKIPVNTRAKLLHDAWNLAYAGDLNFATALNMTLFLQHEREHLAWDPVFTMIDHIGRHIDGSSVHKKFLTYVRMLLTPLYEELNAEQKEGESEGQSNLRNSCKVFLCQAGYKPCIEEAQEEFKKWIEVENPDEGNPVANQYICPVFKWGTKDEWEFGLQRVINFPASRKQNERTYLLKTLAGCPVDSWKIEKLLNITILEKNKSFSDNDIYLIFSMLTGGSSGYTTLFNYLDKNWEAIKHAFEGKPQLWNSLITSSTSVFKTQEGLNMVSDLYSKRKGKFGPSEFVVEKALKNIKEEAKWSNDNLPVIETWLNDYLGKNGAQTEENDKFF